MKRRRAEPIERPEIFAKLTVLLIPMGVGLVAGFAAILALRSAGLRYTWALCAAPVAYLAWVIDWQVGLACATATALAAGVGFHWHHEDIRRGGEEARRARDSIGPTHAARAWASQRRLAERGSVRPAERRMLGGEREAGVALALGRRRAGLSQEQLGRLARVAGTQPSWSVTEKVGGRSDGWFQGREGTRTREREFIVLPDQFKRLRTGEAVLIRPNAKTPGEVVRVLPVRGR
jgi:hypothetical protein